MFRGASGTIRVGYVGFCQELQGCNLFPAPADGGAPASDCPDGQGCLPTTIVNPSGVCFTAAPLLDGGVPPETCASATDCSAGALCVSQGTSTTSSCLPLCAPGSDSNGCATGQTCEGVAYEPLFPDMQSSSWGVCAPNARGSSPITP